MVKRTVGSAYKSTSKKPAATATGKTLAQPKKKTTLAHYKITPKAKELCEILAFKRPHGDSTEDAFVVELCKTVGGTMDAFGNIHVYICPPTYASSPSWLFCCHTDTVHSEGGKQTILVDEMTGEAFIEQRSMAGTKGYMPGNCLGADDGTGVWLLLNMIKAKVPGHYIFHRAEESGGLGSKFIRDNWAAMMEDKKIETAISFDRRGEHDIITHQRGQRGASIKAANILKAQLAKEGLKYELCDGGSFTDTANYFDVVPECFNLSVGYYRQHGPNETQNLPFAEKLLAAVLKINWNELEAHRDPSVVEKKQQSGKLYSGHAAAAPSAWDDWDLQKASNKKKKPKAKVKQDTIAEANVVVEFIVQQPMACMMYLYDIGITEEDIVEYVNKTTGDRAIIDAITLGENSYLR